MKRLLTIVALLVLGCMAVSAQKLTKRTEKHVNSYKVCREFTVLPDGKRHGRCKVYDYKGDFIVDENYTNGYIESFKVLYIDGSVKESATVVPDKSRFYYVCSSYKTYDIYGSTLIDSKVYKQTNSDGLDDYILKGGYDNGYTGSYTDFILHSYRLESYKEKLNNGTITFVTSPDKKTERVKFVKNNGAVWFDVTYNIYGGTIVVNELEGDNYVYKSGVITFNNPIKLGDKIDDDGIVYSQETSKSMTIGKLELPMTRKEFYSNYISAVKIKNPADRYYSYDKMYHEDEHYFVYVKPYKLNLTVDQIMANVKISSANSRVIGLKCAVEHPNGNIETIDLEADYGATSQSATFRSSKGTVISLSGGKFTLKSNIKSNCYNGEGKILGTTVHNGTSMVCLVADGYGNFKSDNVSYEGDFVNGKIDGYGTYVDGPKTYEGQFIDGKLVGQGTYVNGAARYNGNFIAGKFDGQGTITRGKWTIRGTFAQGQLVDGSVEAADMGSYKSVKVLEQGGVEVLFANGNSYVGQPTKDIFGDLNDTDGLRDLCQSKFPGVTVSKLYVSGKYTTASGNIYNGVFTNKALVANSDEVLMSQFVEGSVDVATSTGRYVGEAKSTKFQGKGKLILKSGNSYEGNFVKCVLDPKSAMVVCVKLVSGDSYEGEVLNGLLHGQGVIRCANGDYYEGRFEKGKFLGNGQVRVTDKKGMVYEGNVQNFEYQQDGKVKKVAKYGGKLPVESLAPGFIVY